jgi:DNA-binding transcriptional ArsR family regulator
MSVEAPYRPYGQADLLPYFKALAHESRLKLLGLLAQREHSVQELATLVGVSEPTVSHHLAMLRYLGLVRVREDGNTRWYAFQAEALTELARRLANPESLTGRAVKSTPEDWAAKVLQSFVEPDGTLTRIPASRKKRWVVLAWLAREFEERRPYVEAEVNAALQRHHWDSATLRRELVGYRMMTREHGVYLRLPETDWTPQEGAEDLRR